MTSRLKKTVRRILGLSAQPRPLAADFRRQGDFASLTHEFYGRLTLLSADVCVSHTVFDGRKLWESGIVGQFRRLYRPGTNIVDAGANLGLHSIALAKIASPGATVFAFEPHPEIYGLVTANTAAYPGVHCVNKALSNTARAFHMPSVIDWENAGGCNLGTEASPGGYEVQSVALDDLGIENVGLMKIDVEGHELACIEGARETILRDRPPLVVEIMGGQDRRTAPPELAAEIQRRIDVICDLGYRFEQVSKHDYVFRPR
jgi:FkbM family methyltransferase